MYGVFVFTTDTDQTRRIRCYIIDINQVAKSIVLTASEILHPKTIMFLSVDVNGVSITIEEGLKDKWDNSPASLIVDNGNDVPPASANDMRRLYRESEGFERVAVSQEVFDMGKLPFPSFKLIAEPEDFDSQTFVQAYDPRDPWFGRSDILRYMTPGELNWRGLVNLRPNLPVSQQFSVDSNAVAALKSGQPNVQTSDAGIHPLFRRQNWKDISDVEYEFYKPSLRIASKMLEIDAVLEFFHALGCMEEWTEFPVPDIVKANTEENCPDFQHAFHPRALNDQEKANITQELFVLKDYIKYFMNKPIPISVSGATRPDSWVDQEGNRWPLPGPRHEKYQGTDKESVASFLCFNEIFKVHLDPELARASLNFPGADDRSSLLRLQFIFAITMVHELTHAWGFAVGRDKDLKFEPYRDNDCVSELGYALEATIFGEMVVQGLSGNPCIQYEPFGFRSSRFAEYGADFKVSAYKCSHLEYGLTHYTEYGVPMSFVQRFFTDEFWQDVRRYGTQAIKVPQPFGVRYRLRQDHDDTDDQSVLQAQVRNANKLINRSILHPGIDEGVLFEGWAQNFINVPLDINTGNPLPRGVGWGNVTARVQDHSRYHAARIEPGQTQLHEMVTDPSGQLQQLSIQ